MRGEKPATSRGPVWRSTATSKQRKTPAGPPGSIAAAFQEWMADLSGERAAFSTGAQGSSCSSDAAPVTAAGLLASADEQRAAAMRRRRSMRAVDLAKPPNFALKTASQRATSDERAQRGRDAREREANRLRNLQWQTSQRKAFRHLGRALGGSATAAAAAAAAANRAANATPTKCGGDYCATAESAADRDAEIAHSVSLKLVMEDRVERGVKDRLTARDRARMYNYVGVCNACYVAYQRKAHEELLEERERALEARLAAQELALKQERARAAAAAAAATADAEDDALVAQLEARNEAEAHAAVEKAAVDAAKEKWKKTFSNRIATFYQSGLREEIDAARPHVKMQCPPEGNDVVGTVRYFSANPFLAHRCDQCGCHIDDHVPELEITDLLTVPTADEAEKTLKALELAMQQERERGIAAAKAVAEDDAAFIEADAAEAEAAAAATVEAEAAVEAAAVEAAVEAEAVRRRDTAAYDAARLAAEAETEEEDDHVAEEESSASSWGEDELEAEHLNDPDWIAFKKAKEEGGG